MKYRVPRRWDLWVEMTTTELTSSHLVSFGVVFHNQKIFYNIEYASIGISDIMRKLGLSESSNIVIKLLFLDTCHILHHLLAWWTTPCAQFIAQYFSSNTIRKKSQKILLCIEKKVFEVVRKNIFHFLLTFVPHSSSYVSWCSPPMPRKANHYICTLFEIYK